MSYLNWHVGMKVVCVNSTGAGQLKTGEVYTIAAFDPGAGYNQHLGWDEFGVLLTEVAPDAGTTGFHPKRFRPVQPRKTSIEVFTRILRNPHVRIREDA